MRKTYKDFAKEIDKEQFHDYYITHMPSDTVSYFNLPNLYTLRAIVAYFDIPRLTPSEITHLQMQQMDEETKRMRGKKISDANMGRNVSELTREKIASAQRGKPRAYIASNPNVLKSQFKPNHTPWNKGKHGLQKWVDGQSERRIQTMRERGHIGNRKTMIEKRVESDLIKQFGAEHVHYQYKDARYPFYCDFYIDTEDLFIEVNSWWHHGSHPFDATDPKDIERLEYLKQRMFDEPDNKNWSEAIRIWTVVDPLKQETAKKNHLNYKIIYKY